IPDREFLLRVSYMEIYNETITDLLCDTRKKKPLGIREDVNRNTYVEDLIEEVVVAPEQVMEWIRKGERNRHYGETKMNEHSSRSHTIFRMIIESRERSDPANANCDGAVMVSHLNLVDLAGSERASQTGSEGVRLKEGCNINRSLFILGQVIKKLCDDPSGFINYRDSKLTRILQNSLGGNAKTVIICTITPVSFDETLSTLQFANTAKGMKNTPKVNEVLDDDALLKRYRKEILDLKKQLEEVSSKTQIHAMEKDQLAQLLEEKNSLQKVQEDRIRNLTEMLVTSASFASKEKVKAKRRRRVTWAPAALENSGYDSHCLMVPDQISEEDWIAGPNTQKDFEESVQLCEALALEKDIAVNEVNVLQANFDNLVLENEQLKSEINELKERLKEKAEIDEFEALEKQTQKDHEIQLMHEITNLKNLISNAEVYNEELEAEINSKLEQLKEKENKIKILQNRVEELQKAEVEKKETSFALGDCDKLTEKIQQLNKSLLDSETNELLNDHNQMQKDVQLYQSQIEAGKASYRKMQADLQRELQSLFQENTRLTSLMEDLFSRVELEKKAADLKGELENALKENALLQKQVNELSEFQSLPNTVETQKKEIVERCEELRLLKLENEKLLSEVADNEMRLKHMSEEIEKSKDNLTDVQLKYTKCDEEYVALKQLHEEIEQKYIAASETNEQMKLQIECLSKEAQESKTILDEVKLELSSKMKELEEKEAEQKQLLELRENLVRTQQKLKELEQLKDKERISEVRLEAKDLEIQAVLQQLTECQEEIKTLTQERDDLKKKEEFLQAETEQLREDIKDTVSMNILAHEDLRNTQNSLKESQKSVKKLEQTVSEKESQILSVEEALGKTIKELQIQRDQLAEEKSESNTCRESDQLQVQKEQIIFLTQENRSLQDKLDSLLLKTEECGEGTWLTEVTENLTRVSAEYGDLLAEKQQTERAMSEQLERITSLNKEKDELQHMVETCKEREEHLLQVQRQSETLKDSLTNKIQQLTETLNSVSCEKDHLLAERTNLSLQLKEQISSVSQERDELQKLLQDVRSERDQLKTELQRNSEMCVETKAKLEDALEQMKQRNLNNMSIQVNPVDIAEQAANDSLTDKTLKIKELLEKFPSMGKRYECLSTVSLKLKSELNSQKALLAVVLPQLPLEQSKQVKMLQTKNEDINTRLQKLLTKLKLLFSSVCTKRREYHTTVHKYEMELLEEKRKQDHLQSQIQCLRNINLKQNEVSSQGLNSCEGLQSFYLDAESILKDVSEMENELLCIEAELDQEASARKETIQFWEVCSETHWDTEELKEELKKDNERLLQIFKFWTPKVKMLLELSSELDARTADYSKNADVELKQRKEKNEELLQDLNTLKEKLAPGGSASLALEEENYRLHNKLKAAEQDKKAMEVKIQKLENVINEVGESIKERDDRISKLQAQMRIRTETSELTQLQAKLNEMDNCLRTALREKQSLQAKLDEGAELYKEEIDHLKTQLVKCDLERMKQSNSFERKLANYEALAEHQEQQLSKLKEELRRAYQEQDVTVLKEADPQQPQKPLTCGGGSGIVQSTQILVLKSEQAKLQKENLQLKKQNDLLLSDELQLKEELRKWKERALKLREQSLRETTQKTIPKSPKKAVSYFFKEQTPSPCKETVSQETVTQDLPKPLNPTRPTNFFDNSNLGVLTDTRPEGRESTQEHLRHFFGTPDRDKAPDCKTHFYFSQLGKLEYEDKDGKPDVAPQPAKLLMFYFGVLEREANVLKKKREKEWITN
ncbi:hypothetical protein EK904_006208, partial [Melospiza melodia maxima]